MELNAFTGTRLNYNVFDLNKDNVINSADAVPYQDLTVSASGIKTEVGLVSKPAVLNAGGREFKYLAGTSGGIQKVNENPGSQQFGRQSWRQLR
jgi:type IV pilus assembly protein PilY1